MSGEVVDVVLKKTRVYRVDSKTLIAPGSDLEQTILVRAGSAAAAEKHANGKFLMTSSRIASADDVAVLVAGGAKIEVAG